MKRTGFKPRTKPMSRGNGFTATPKALKTRAPMRQKAKPTAKSQARSDPAYLVAVRRRRCCVCEKFGLVQTSPTEAHHPICGRYSTQKAPDRDALPLCCDHHQGLRFDRDRTKLAIHQGKASWVEAYGPDTDYIEPTQLAILGEAA